LPPFEKDGRRREAEERCPDDILPTNPHLPLPEYHPQCQPSHGGIHHSGTTYLHIYPTPKKRQSDFGFEFIFLNFESEPYGVCWDFTSQMY